MDRAGVETPVSLIDVGGSSSESLIGDPGVTMPISGTVTANLGATDNGVLDAIAASLAGTLLVNGSGVTQPVSGTVTAELSATDNAVLDAIQAAVEGTLTVGLPSGAATAAKQPALGTAGSASADVITVQGVALMTPILVNGSGVTQPISAATLPLPTGAATSANQTTIIGHVDGIESGITDAVTALQVMDDWDETNRCKVNLIVGQAGVSAGSGAVDATTQRMILATDDPAVALLTTMDADTGNIATAASAIQTSVQLLDDAVYTSGSGTPSKGLAVMGTDGTNPRIISVDSSGNVQVDLVSANVTNTGTFATQATLQAGTAYAGKVRLTDGTTDTDIRDLANSNALNVAIVDDSGDQITSFGGGTQYAVDAALGANPTGTLAIAIRDDALSTLTPVEGDAVGLRVNDTGALWVRVDGGSIAAVQSGAWNVGVTSSALPSGAATSAAQTTGNTALNAIQTAVEILDNAISGAEMQVDVVSSALPTGAATSANQSTANTALAAIQTAVQILDNAISGNEMQVDVVSSALPSGAATSANQSTMITSLQLLDDAISGSEMQVDVVAALPAGTNTIGVVINERVSTATLSNVSGSASSVQLLASTAGRKGASFHNDSTAVAYVKFGTTASTTSFTVKMNPDAHYELPQPVFTGRIDCIWAAANGAMRITEYT